MQLRIPGPTPLPLAVREAQSREMINHRGSEFAALIRDLTQRLRPIFQTKDDILLLTASGTGGLEAAIVNTLSPGDRVLSVSGGVFGERFRAIAKAYGADVIALEIPWGRAADPATIVDRLRTHGPFKAILVTHNETSTGVSNDLEAIAGAVRDSGALLLVDAISSLGSIEIKTDAWGCDVVVTCSQKGLMSPPGLAVVSVSPRAWAASEQARMPRFYWDLRQYQRTLEKGQTPATPAISLYFALQAALGLIEAEGPSNVYARHQNCAERARQGIVELGLELFADPRHASETVTAVKVPAEVDAKRLLELTREDGVILAGGQGALSGKIIRMGHLGNVRESDVDSVIAALGRALPRAKREAR